MRSLCLLVHVNVLELIQFLKEGVHSCTFCVCDLYVICMVHYSLQYSSALMSEEISNNGCLILKCLRGGVKDVIHFKGSEQVHM
jgi:hypothetical protein